MLNSNYFINNTLHFEIPLKGFVFIITEYHRLIYFCNSKKVKSAGNYLNPNHIDFVKQPFLIFW